MGALLSSDSLEDSCYSSARNSVLPASLDGEASWEDCCSTLPASRTPNPKLSSGSLTSPVPSLPLDSLSASSSLPSLRPPLSLDRTSSSVESPSMPEATLTNSTSSSSSKTEFSLTWNGTCTCISSSSSCSSLVVWLSNSSTSRKTKRRTPTTSSTPSETTDLFTIEPISNH